jgi:hypothetical protein
VTCTINGKKIEETEGCVEIPQVFAGQFFTGFTTADTLILKGSSIQKDKRLKNIEIRIPLTSNPQKNIDEVLKKNPLEDYWFELLERAKNRAIRLAFQSSHPTEVMTTAGNIINSNGPAIFLGSTENRKSMAQPGDLKEMERFLQYTELLIDEGKSIRLKKI